MFEVIQANLDTSIAMVTLIVSVLVIFLGLGDNKKGKQEQLKFVLASYSVIMLIILFFSEISIYLGVVLVLFFLLGGLSYSINENFNLEKELDSLQLLFYSSFSWFFITSNYFLMFSIVMVYVLKFNYYASLIIISISLIFQYLSIVKDYFGINTYKQTFDKLNNINLDAVPQSEESKKIFEDYLFENRIELVAFVLYVEDRYLFDRKNFHISLKNILDARRDPVIFKGKINYDQKSWRNKYKRGYSTIEQQLIRQYSIADQSYRYKYRRKLFFDWIYTPLFSKAICRRKSKVYGRYKRTAKKELIWNLKMMFLYNYFIKVLKDPKNEEELITNMSKQSRVSKNVYKKMFEIFQNSSKKEDMKNIIKNNIDRDYNFY